MARELAWRVAASCVVAEVWGCSDRAGTPVPGAEASAGKGDATDVADVPDAPDAADGPNAPGGGIDVAAVADGDVGLAPDGDVGLPPDAGIVDSRDTAAGRCDCAPPAPCTVVGCDPATGACIVAVALDGTPCDDGDRCSIGDSCFAGECVPGTPMPCEDGKACTVDACDAVAGECTHAATPGCVEPVCEGAGDCGTAASGSRVSCSPTGQCMEASVPGCLKCAVDSDCDDGDPCTFGFCNAVGWCDHLPYPSCAGAACSADGDCDDGEDCTADLCTPQGYCRHVETACPPLHASCWSRRHASGQPARQPQTATTATPRPSMTASPGPHSRIGAPTAL